MVAKEPMADTLTHIRAIRARHFFYNRALTVALMALVCATGGILALFETAAFDRYKMLTGTVIMLLAVLLYKIPYFAYRLNRAWFIKDQDSLQLMGDSWRLYKLRILNFDRFS